MELDNLIPDNNSNWVVRSNFLMFKKLEYIPVAYIEDDIVYILLDARLIKQMIKLIKHIQKLNIKFYLTTPEISNPSGVLDLNEKVIKHYLLSFAKKEFYDSFKKIEFDLIDNMVKWTEKENCFDLVKPVYQDVLKTVNRQNWDYYSNKKHFDYCQEIRDEFKSLYRHIQISKIL